MLIDIIARSPFCLRRSHSFRYRRGTYSNLSSYSCRRQPQFRPCSERYSRPYSADSASSSSALQFRSDYAALRTFLFNDLLKRFPRTLVFELPQLSLFRFLEDLLDEIAAAKYPLIELFSPSSSLLRQHLRPPTLAAHETTAGQFFYCTLTSSFPYKPSILMQRLLSRTSELQQDGLYVHPWMLILADNSSMSGPWISVQFFDGFDCFYPQRIEVNVADEG